MAEPSEFAKVMAFDFGDPLTRVQVEYALRVGRYPKRAAADRGVAA